MNMLKLTSTVKMNMCCCQTVCMCTVKFFAHYDT